MIRVLALAILAELVIIAIGVVTLAVRRRRNVAREARLDVARGQLARWLGDVLGGAPERIAELGPVLAPLPAEDARAALTAVGEQIDLEGRRVLRRVFEAHGLASSSVRDRSRGRTARLVLTREARALDDPAGLVATLARDEDVEVALSAVEAMCELGRAAECSFAIEALAARGPRTRARLVDAFAATSPHPVAALVPIVEVGSPPAQQVALAVLGHAQALESVPLIERCLSSDDAEVRVQALRALRAIGDPGSADRARALLADPRWEVRAEAVRTTAALAGRAAAEWITPLLTDDADWVRHHAAHAIAAAGGRAAEELRAAAARGEAAAKSAIALHELGLGGRS